MVAALAENIGLRRGGVNRAHPTVGLAIIPPVQRTQVIAVLVLLVVALLVGTLVCRGRQAPFLPVDADHARFVGHGPCDECHGPDAGAPRGENHPIGNDCMRCHAYP